jgi:hypothetical protein
MDPQIRMRNTDFFGYVPLQGAAQPAAKKDDFIDDTDEEEPVDDSDADATWELKDTDEDD